MRKTCKRKSEWHAYTARLIVDFANAVAWKTRMTGHGGQITTDTDRFDLTCAWPGKGVGVRLSTRFCRILNDKKQNGGKAADTTCSYTLRFGKIKLRQINKNIQNSHNIMNIINIIIKI